MSKYLSPEPISHHFDQLPTDMIYYEIFPYLDYDSRVTANLLLPRKDRLRTPLRKDAVLEFHHMLGLAAITPIIKKQAAATSKITRNRQTLKLWRTLPLFPQLYQYGARFRAVAAAKATEFSDPSTYEFSGVSDYTRKEVIKLCQAFLLSLETSYPYVRELDFTFPGGNWSAVSSL
jgi:hypothetical protein